jgi:hypothetical protein
VEGSVDDDADNLFYTAAGPLAAILLGMVLTPLRGLTPASNLAFAFMALTIVAADLGGRGAALATALASALSLDFFLTQPYLQLAMEDKHDVIAFLGLSVCGLIAAALSAQRSLRLASLSGASRRLGLLHTVLVECQAPLEQGLLRAVQELQRALPLSAAVVRDDHDRVLAGDREAGLRPIPRLVLEPDHLQPVGAAPERPDWDLALPREGGRIGLSAHGHTVGWLDVWGDGGPASPETRRCLSDAARLLGLRLAARPPAGR